MTASSASPSAADDIREAVRGAVCRVRPFRSGGCR